MRGIIGLLALLLTAEGLEAQETVFPTGTTAQINEADLRTRLTWLASDAMRGRDTTSAEATLASEYIAHSWAQAGLIPKGTDGWFQPFAVPEPVLDPGNAFVLHREGKEPTAFAVESDWNPFAMSAAAKVRGDVAFCGYGISAPKRSYDDYAGMDVKGKIVLVLRKNPGWREFHHASFRRKLAVAHEKGAAALLLCNNPATTKDGTDRIGHWSAAAGGGLAGSGPIPFAFISQTMADQILAPLGKSLAAWERRLRSKGPASSAVPDTRVELQTAISSTKDVNARNVVGFLPGRDPDVADDVVVVGAHYDHVGMGLFGSTGGAAASGQVHNGADDNGSGTAAILELAQWFAVPANRPRRSLLFIAFTGEERGLLGSRHYVNHPTVPLQDTVAMINLDMVGRARQGRLQVGGVGTAQGLKDLVASANAPYKLQVSWDPSGTAPTDSTSFFRKRIPVLFFFTMTHKDYHRPTDDVERINFPDMTRICHFVRDTTMAIADREPRLSFTKPPRPPRPPRLGVQLAREPVPFGVPIAGVVPDGPADKAGMEAGDILISLAGQATKDPRGLLQVLRGLKPGKSVSLQVRRDDREVPLTIVLGTPRPRRQ